MSVESLRGAHGADFEGKAAVLRGAPQKPPVERIMARMLPFLFYERDFVAYGEVRGDTTSS